MQYEVHNSTYSLYHQVDLALSVEKRMPSKMRQWLLTGEIKIRPNQKPNLCERFLYTIWGGRGCDPAEIRQAALQSKQVY